MKKTREKRKKEKKKPREFKVIKHVFLLVFLCVSVCLGTTLNVRAQATGKQTEQFANLVVFVQFEAMNPADGSGSDNFMNHKIYDYESAPSNTDMALEFWGSTSAKPKILKNYLKTISYGQFSVNSILPQYDSATGIIKPFILPASVDNDVRLIQEVYKQLEATYGSLGDTLDYNGDGFIDNLTVLLAGDNPSNRDDFNYPHKYEYPGGELVYRDKTIHTYNVLNETAVFENMKSGVVIHEFMHSIGFSDLYKYSGTQNPIGVWDIMAATSSFVQSPLVYMRQYAKDWVQMDTITESTQNLSLVPSDQADGNQAYIIKSPLSDTEFFVVEYRKQGSQEILDEDINVKIPGNGLIVYRVDKSVERLANSGSKNGIEIFVKGLNRTPENNAEMNQAFLSKESGRIEIGSTVMTDTQDLLSFSDGSNSGIKIKNVGSAGDTITFDVEYADLSEEEVWENLGSAFLANEDAGGISIDQDSNYIPYVVYQKNGVTSSTIKCMRYVDKKWEVVGDSIVAANASDPLIKIYKDIPYVLYHDSNYALKVKKFVNNAWMDAGTVQSENTLYYNAVVESDGIYVLYSADESGFASYSYSIAKLDEASVKEERIPVASGSLSNPSLCKDGEILYVAFRNVTTEKAQYYEVNGTTSTEHITDIYCTVPKGIINNHDFYLAVDYQGEKAVKGLTVYKCNGSMDTKVGESLVSGKNSAEFDVASCNNILYVAGYNQDTGQMNLWYESEGSWVQKGTTIEKGEISDFSFTVQNGIIYCSYLMPVGTESYSKVKYNLTPDNEGQTPDDPEVTSKPTKSPTQSPTKSPTESPTKTPVVTQAPAPAVAKPAKVTQYKIKKKWRRLRVKWKKTAGATSYQVYRRIGGKGKYKKVKTLSASKRIWYNTKCKKGKTYYYKVRAVKTVNGKKYYGAFSKIKKCKI